ncbi:MAG: cyclic nucleotide-binding domain-containing protein [Chloroflexota bacterium]
MTPAPSLTVTRDNDDLAAPEVLEARVALLQRLPVFYTFPLADLRALARAMRSTTAAAGAKVTRKGGPANVMFIIEEGRCEVRVASSPGHSVTIELFGPGDFFGLNAVFASEAYPGAVIAVTDCLLLELSGDDLIAALGEESPAVDELRKLATQRAGALERWTERVFTGGGKRSATLTAVYSAKGGSGKTTIALNLAAHLGELARGEVVLVDLALPHNHAAMMANLVPTESLALVDQSGSFDDALLGAFVDHRGGFTLLPGTLKASQADLITPDLVSRAIDWLQNTFNYVVFDLGVGLSEVTLRVLERAHQVVLVVTPELTNLKDSAEILETFTNVLQIPAGRVTVLLNHPRPATQVRNADIEHALGRPISCELPFDGPRFDQAGVRGEILTLTEPGSRSARSIRELGDLITPRLEVAS